MNQVKIAIVGSGPAALMAAYELSRGPNTQVYLFEKRSLLGWKLLIAGSSGLNVANDYPLEEFFSYVQAGDHKELIKAPLQSFFTPQWIEFLEKILGLEVFLGSSRRYFVKDMKAARLLKRWTEVLLAQNVKFQFGHELLDFSDNVELKFLVNQVDLKVEKFDHAFFFLGGGSWEDQTPVWPKMFLHKGIAVAPFTSSNVGYEVAWTQDFLKEAARTPLKNVIFKNRLGQKQGDLLVTEYGLEGTPIYLYGESGEAALDLKPELSYEQILTKLKEKESKAAIKSPMKLIKKYLALCPAALGLLFHFSNAEEKLSLQKMAAKIKSFPLVLGNPRPLSEAISSRGGILLSELNPNFSLKKIPAVSVGGEMLDWDAPTGGFLIMNSVAQGYYSATRLLF